MLTEARGPDPLGSAAPRQPPTAGKDVKGLGNHHRRHGEEYQQHMFSKRSSFFGLETKPELVWEDWDLGKEFTKTIVLKNIHNKLQKLHLRPPESEFFTIITPQLIVISPRTSFSLPVTFRPLQRCEYMDSIEFQGKDGSFQVCLHATIPCYALKVPDSVLLPLCAVQHYSQTTFCLKNASKLQTCFQWVCAEPFQLSPEQGLLKPGQECHITVVFRPQEALVYQQQAYCRFGEEGNEAESCCAVLLQGLAKYPCLQLRNPAINEEKQQRDPVLRFGSVAVGQSLQKHFDICNPSPVTASFFLSKLSGRLALLGSEFSCDVSKGKVAPGGSVRATVTYSPAVVDTISVDYLSVECTGALNKTLLKLTGSSIGPKVSLSSSVVDFGHVNEGGAVTQTVKLVNSSPVDTVYLWDLDCTGHSVFSIQPTSGILSPHSYTTLKVVFRPSHPIAHYRRVACLILHRDPLFLDLIGTCHSELRHPAILKPEHLVSYKPHWYHGQDPPSTISATRPDCIVPLDQQGVHSSQEEQSDQRQDNATAVPQTPMEEFFRSYSGCMDPHSSISSSSPQVSVVPSELLFNHKISSSFSTSSASSQYVSITNHTRGKLSLAWTVVQDSPFIVSPSSCDLAPLKSFSFKVTYDPKQLNTLHGAQLECFAHSKTDNHYIDEQLLCLPWCVTVRVIGHSFQSGKQHFIPCCSLRPPQVVFSSLTAVSYESVLLQNDGNLPLTFCLDYSSVPALADCVSVIPSCGLIQPGHQQILTLRTTPIEDNSKQGFNLQLQLNATKHTKELTVVSVVENLCVSLEGDGSLYFQPTALGSRTQRSHHIRNLSSVPLRFQWSIPEPYQELISVEPDASELHPNESSSQTWFFSPLEEKTYIIKPTLTFWPVQTDGCNKSQLTLKVVGKGSIGFIEAEQGVLDLGETLVGSYRSIEIPLVNKSPCPLSFCLSVQQTLLDEEVIYDPKSEPCALQLDCERGTITSNCTMLLRSTVRPQRQAQYMWTISYQTLNVDGFALSPLQAVCEVRAKSVFPTLQVTDVNSAGSVSRLSKVRLWKLLSLDSLNKHLLSNPSSAELTYRTPTRHSMHNCPSVFTKAIVDFNFSAAPKNSDPTTCVLMFHNPGSISVDWAILFPEDQQIELEYWAETGEFSSNELHQMKVQDNRLFSISPRTGTLHPGQQRAIQFSYSHDLVGINRLPVVFKLSYGREILINVQGMTVETDRPCLHFASTQHVFTSVTIGDCSPPRQVYELHNAGAVPVHYEVDTAVLSQLQMDNFNHPVLCCLNPVGEVLPGNTAMLEWIFSPLEAKTYCMEIPIHVQDGDSTLVTFEGCGLDNHTLGFSNPLNCSDTKSSTRCVQRVPFTGQVAFLSEDSVSLGDIPVCSQSSRIFFLTNVSYTDTVLFTWDLSQQRKQQVVQIHPEQGSLCPGQNVLCVLTFTSTDYPTVYRIDLVCQVIREAALTLYHESLQHWEKEKQRLRDEFTITDKSLSEIQGDLLDKELVAAPARKGLPLRKYKTLPPICTDRSYETMGCISSKLTKAERRALRDTVKEQKQPEPPQPALLHLEVTAHSHGFLEYLTHFPQQYNSLYRCLHSVKSQKSKTTSSSSSLSDMLPPPTHEPQKNIVIDILTSLLWNILDDSDFIHSLITLVSKPVTYQPTEASHRSSICTSSSPPPELQHQVLLTETKSGLDEEYHTVDMERTAGCSANTPQTQDTLHSKHVLADMSEEVLLNTLQNLMVEAVRGELDLTARPRSVILPPVSPRTRKMSRPTAGYREDLT